LRLRREKLEFAAKEVKYLGYLVSTTGIAPDSSTWIESELGRNQKEKKSTDSAWISVRIC